MFENDTASHGLMTVEELRKRLNGIPAEAVVNVCVDGVSYAPVTASRFEPPEYPDEGEIGIFLVIPDPSSYLVRSLRGDPTSVRRSC